MVESKSFIARLFDGLPPLGQSGPAPAAVTPDIANTPSQFPTLFSRESWERYCVAKHGPKAAVLASSIFDHIARLDGSNDGVLNIDGLHAADITEVFGFGEIDAVFDKFEGPYKDAIREDLNQLHHNAGMRPHRGELYMTKIGENRFFAMQGDTDYAHTITSRDLNGAWERAQALHPGMEWMRLVTHTGYHVGRTNNPLNADHQAHNIAIMQSDLLVTGGVGIVRSTAEMWIAPAGRVDHCVSPSDIEVIVTGTVGLLYLGFAVLSRGQAVLPPLPAVMNGAHPSRVHRATVYSKAVLGRLMARLERAKASGQQFVTAHMGNAPVQKPTQPYVELNMNPIGKFLDAAAAVLKRRPSEPSGGFALPPAEPTPKPEPKPVAAGSWLNQATRMSLNSVVVDLSRVPGDAESVAIVIGNGPKAEVQGNVISVPHRAVVPKHLEIIYTPARRRLDITPADTTGPIRIGFDHQKPVLLRDGVRYINVHASVKTVVFRLGEAVDVALTLPAVGRTSSPAIAAVQSPTARHEVARMSQTIEPLHAVAEPASSAGVMEPTQPARPTGQIRDTDRQPPRNPPSLGLPVERLQVARPTTPVPVAVEMVAAIKKGLAEIPGVKGVSASEFSGSVNAGASSPNGNSVAVMALPGRAPAVGGALVRHLAAFLTGPKAPVPIALSIKIEPDAAFDTLTTNKNGFSNAARARANEGGVVSIHFEKDGKAVRDFDHSVSDAGVVSMIRITGSVLTEPKSIMRVEIILPRRATQDVAVLNQHLNHAKSQLLAGLWSVSSSNTPVFLELFPQVSLTGD